MNQCKACAKWTQSHHFGWDYGYCKRETTCTKEILTWADACCPAFEARKDWADKATEEIWKIIDCGDKAKVSELISNMLRVFAKAHYEGGKRWSQAES